MQNDSKQRMKMNETDFHELKYDSLKWNYTIFSRRKKYFKQMYTRSAHLHRSTINEQFSSKCFTKHNCKSK